MGYSKVPVDGKINLRRYQRKFNRVEKSIRNKLFPLKPEWLLWIIFGIAMLNFFGLSPMNKTIDDFSETLDSHFGSSIWNKIGAILLIGLFLCTILTFFIRLGFTLMLYYHGWLFETIGHKVSMPTKIFMGIIKFVNRYASFFSFADLMPWLFVPNLDATIKKYLRSVRPLLDDEKYDDMVKLSEEFKNTIGRGLQRKLWLKWLTSKNYVSDWWKEVVYMRYRNSLLNTNVGAGDVLFQKTTHIQAARAANVVYLRLQFIRDLYQKQSMKPVNMRENWAPCQTARLKQLHKRLAYCVRTVYPITLGGIPLCPSQYDDYYRTLRAPKETSDEMIRVPETKHIAVHCKGCWYKLNVFHGRRLIRPAELERSIQAIIDRTPDPEDHEPMISALTCGPRDLWARIRREKFGKGTNLDSLSVIETALDIVFLDDKDREYDEDDVRNYEDEIARSLHGNGYQVWCDKPTVYLISKNGRMSSNGEHSVVDAMIYVHIREYTKYHEQYTHTYFPDGHCRGDVEVVPTADRLKWELDDETKSAIDEAYECGKKVADDFENACLVFQDFGKDFMKKIRVSPDAFIQMAIQMAYYKDQGKFDLTYESSVMRLFKEGRTETVRSVSLESCDFVRSMMDPNFDDKTRFELLQKACDQHQDYYRQAMAGHGVDRHLFALYIVSKYFRMNSPFLDAVFSMPFALSTSQTPQHQMTEYMSIMNKEKELFWPCGGFSCPEGSNYGVCYTIGATGDIMSFHISSWKSLHNTDPKRFRETLVSCLREIKIMAERAVSSKS